MSGSLKARSQALGLEVVGVIVVLWAINRMINGLPVILRVLLIIAIPSATAFTVWKLSTAPPRIDEDESEQPRQLLDRLPRWLVDAFTRVVSSWWFKAIIMGLNIWALRALWIGATATTREHPYISAAGWLVFVGLLVWLALDRPEVHPKVAWKGTRAYNIWGASASRMLGSPDKRQGSESFNERLTRERMEALTAEHAERIERERLEAEAAARRAREYDAKFGTSEGN